MKNLGIADDSSVYLAILASMGEGIIFADHNNRIVCINRAAEQIRNIKASNFLGRDLLAMHTPLARERIGKLLIALRDGTLPSHTRPLRTRSGVYQNSYYPIRDSEGNFLGTVMVSRDITENEQLKQENTVLRHQIMAEFTCGEMIGQSVSMQPVFQVIRATAPIDSTILIGGESGTGKELVARAIHQQSRRSRAPMIKVNCAALPENLLESELFGYEKGAFTGATHERKGKFEQAHRGTIFLDEIGEMPLPAQAKLLRVLQEKTVERIGGNREIRVDVRIIAATNRDLQEEVARGRFREDLFYRLNVIPIQMPPLRDRREDIPHLTRKFLDNFAEQMGKTPLQLSPEARALLLSYDYPGNVRELKNAVERAVALCPGKILLGDDLPPNFRTSLPQSRTSLPESRTTPPESRANLPHHSRMNDGSPLATNLSGYEDELIDKALQAAGQHKGEAAKLLGISRKTLWKKLKQREASKVTAG